MAVVLSEVEALPSAYPAAPEGLSEAAAAVDAALVWQRLEAWVAVRWTVRDAHWIVEGPGHWSPRLRPAVIATVEVWRDDWQPVSLPASPLGGYFLESETYRISGTAGSATTPPAAVLEAYKRLAEYFAGIAAAPSAGFVEERDGDYSYRKFPTWAARAMGQSGAADLLRGYRT